VYFSLQFVDAEMLVPVLEPLVFIGQNLVPNDVGTLYFQDAGSYWLGTRFDSARDDQSAFYAQGEDEIEHIFEYERALELLVDCSMRRRNPPR